MTRTRTAPIEETFGLIAVEEYGGKVRLYTQDELWPWINQEVSLVAPRAARGRDKDQNCHPNGDAGLRLYLKAGAYLRRPKTDVIVALD